MKIAIVEESPLDAAEPDLNSQLISILLKLGHDVCRLAADALLFENIIKEKPDLVYSLVRKEMDTARRIPALLEIAAVQYAGPGMMALSFNCFYNLLFPLLTDSGILTSPFLVMKAGQPFELGNLDFPLRLHREGYSNGQTLNTKMELNSALKKIPERDEVILFGHVNATRKHIYLLGERPLVGKDNSVCIEPAVRAYCVMEGRGLARFDFLCSDKVLLTEVEMAPHPLEPLMVREAAEYGWDTEKLIQQILEDAVNG